MINFDRVAKSLVKYFLYAFVGIISFVFIGEALLQGLLWFFQLVPEEAIFGYYMTDKIQINAGEFVTIIAFLWRRDHGLPHVHHVFYENKVTIGFAIT